MAGRYLPKIIPVKLIFGLFVCNNMLFELFCAGTSNERMVLLYDICIYIIIV